MAQYTAFYAYPSKPPSLAESIEEAIKRINARKIIRVTRWVELKSAGKVIISEICREITKNQLFMCDISGLNPNVMFELGFAIAKNKRIWITVDQGIPNNTELIKKINVLSQIGYRGYINYDDIVKTFFKDNPYADLEETLLKEYEGLVNSLSIRERDIDIFYLKSVLEHTASKKLTQFLSSLRRKIVIDDKLENNYQPLNWYLSNIIGSRIVITHLLGNNQADNQIANAKYSLYAGMAFGFNRKLLMLAPDPFETPLDYQDILLTHCTARECVEKTQKWVYPVLSQGEREKNLISKSQKQEDNELTLIKIRLGESIAEYEESQLDSYFVETSQYKSGIETVMGIFVGRKGTGKTANLIKVREYFLREKSNLVIVVKPISFNLETYIKLISTYFRDLDLSADLTERIWKFLVYTKIAEDVYNLILRKPTYYERTHFEKTLVEYVELNIDIICADLGEKIDYIYNNVCSLVNEGKNAKNILEIVFNKHLSSLIKILQGVLKPYQRVILLFDNLDKAWEIGRNEALKLQSQIIYGLFGFQNTFKRDLQWTKGDARLLIFLREDIFDFVLKGAREPDKILLNTHKILWNDTKLLLRVIEERFKACDPDVTNSQVWEKYFCKAIDGIPTKEYIISHVLPRPRDLIYVVSNAIDECVNHNHLLIDESDIKKALGTYFEFLLENITTEFAVDCPKIRNIILSFIGTKAELSWYNLSKKLRNIVGIDISFQKRVEQLIRISFLGMIINNQSFFAYNELDTEKLLKKLAVDSKKVIFSKSKFIIHPAFSVGLHLTGGQVYSFNHTEKAVITNE